MGDLSKNYRYRKKRLIAHPYQQVAPLFLVHQVAPLAQVKNLTTRWRHLHFHIALDGPFGIISLTNSMELISASARVTSVMGRHPKKTGLFRTKQQTPPTHPYSLGLSEN